MSVININRAHQYPLVDLKLKIDGIRKDVDKKFEFCSEWETDRHLLFRRKGVNGSIEIDEHNFQFRLNLGMMYRMMEAQIKKEIVSVVDGHLS